MKISSVMAFRKWIDRLLDLIYPPRCIFCKGIIPIQKEKGICEDCLNTVSFVKGKVCQRCGKPIIDFNNKNTCHDCIKYPPIYEKGWAVFVYEGVVRDAIYRFKYGGHREYAKYFGVLMGNKIKEQASNNRFDLIIPIPIHRSRKKIRGYNQAEELAKVISRELDVPMDTSILTRTKNTKPQSGLSTIQRQNNIREAFAINEKIDIKGKKILLIDDIYTTGSTINSCSNLIKKRGANKVYYISLTIGHDIT